MASESDIPSPNPGENNIPGEASIPQMRFWRQELAALRPQNPEALAQALQIYVAPIEQVSLATLTQRASFMPHIAASYAERYNIPPGPSLSRFVGRETVQDTHDCLQQMAVTSRWQGKPIEYVAWYDMAHGMTMAIDGLGRGNTTEDEFESTFKQAQLLESEQTTLTFSPAMKHLIMRTARMTGEEYRRMLTEDPTGFLVVDTNVARLHALARGEQRTLQTAWMIQPYQVPEFVVAGAELGQKIYKSVYSSTQETPSPEPLP